MLVECTGCHEEKPFDRDHFLVNHGVLQRRCRACHRAERQAWEEKMRATLEDLVTGNDEDALAAFVRRHAKLRGIIPATMLRRYAPDLLKEMRERQRINQQNKRDFLIEQGLSSTGKPYARRGEAFAEENLAAAKERLKKAKTRAEIRNARRTVYYWSHPEYREKIRERQRTQVDSPQRRANLKRYKETFRKKQKEMANGGAGHPRTRERHRGARVPSGVQGEEA